MERSPKDKGAKATYLSNLATVGSELFAYGLLCVYIYAGHLRYGLRTTLLFLVGSLYWTLVLENVGVLMNFFSYENPNPALNPFYILWVGLTPLWISVGWFDITFSAYMLLGEALPRVGLWTRAMLGGFLAVSLDLVIDPAATALGLWRWVHPSFYFLGVPITNYIGWFLLGTFYLAVFESVILRKRFLVLNPLLERSKDGIKQESTVRTSLRLVRRLMVFQIVFVVIYVPIVYSIANVVKLPGG